MFKQVLEFYQTLWMFESPMRSSVSPGRMPKLARIARLRAEAQASRAAARDADRQPERPARSCSAERRARAEGVRPAVNDLVPDQIGAALAPAAQPQLRRGIELGFFRGKPLIYDGTEPVAIDAQAGKGKLTRFLGVNLVSPRTAHLTKIITDPKDGELAWVSWKTLERQGYRVRFINPGRLHGYPSPRATISRPGYSKSRSQPGDARPGRGKRLTIAPASLVPVDPHPSHRWIGQGVRTAFALYLKIAALYPSERFACSCGGLWDFFGRGRDEIADDLLVWASDGRMQDESGMCRQIASLTQSRDQWNAYSSVIIERLQGFQPGSAYRAVTEANSFDPADMKRERTALFIIGSRRARKRAGASSARWRQPIVERFADARGDLCARSSSARNGASSTSRIFTRFWPCIARKRHQLPRRVPECAGADRKPLWARAHPNLAEGRGAHALSRPSRYRHAERD